MAPLRVPCPNCQGVNQVAAGRLPKARCGRCKTPLRPTAPLDVDDATFDALVQGSDVPVLLDLWSPTCGPCLQVAPHVAELARHHAGEIVVAKIDVSRHPGVAQRLGVRGVPTFAVFQEGRPVRQQAGAMPLPQLEAFVKPYLQ